jgi:Ca2+-binding RTX toxin-like protein
MPVKTVLGYADTVLDFFDSGAGPLSGPYGGTYPGSYPAPVSLDVVLGKDGSTVDFLSLPTGSSVVVGFRDEVILDRAGNDIFVTEVANEGERADVYVSSNNSTFHKVGQATGGTEAAFDLAEIGFRAPVTAIKIVGLNNAGGSPGYDVVNVRALHSADLSRDNRLVGGDTDDLIAGRGGADRLSGKGGADELLGGSGGDWLDGGPGRDRLAGGSGDDTFYFDAAPRVRNADRVVDFVGGEDHFRLSASRFDAVDGGRLHRDAFCRGEAAEDRQDRILYDNDSGRLYYDADGTGRADSALVARVNDGTSLGAADFLVG